MGRDTDYSHDKQTDGRMTKEQPERKTNVHLDKQILTDRQTEKYIEERNTDIRKDRKADR
jgi:hypothetical protein